MLNLWLNFFLIGCLIGRSLGWSDHDWIWLHWLYHNELRWLVCGALLLASVKGLGVWRRYQRGLLALSASVWGLAHSAPPLSEVTPAATVVQTDWNLAGPGPVLVLVDDQVFQTAGPRSEGAVGKARVVTRRRLLSRRTSRLQLLAGETQSTGLFSTAGARLHTYLETAINRLPWLQKQWLRAMLLGDRGALSPAMRNAVQATGLYHLVIISGLQVALVARLASGLLRLIPQTAYALRLLSPVSWGHMAAAIDVLVALASLLFVLAVGCPVSAQRAVLMVVTWHLGHALFGVLPASLRVRFVLATQALVFPAGILTEASILGWGAYVLVMNCLHARDKGAIKTLRGGLLLQVEITLLVAGVFGQISLIGPLLLPIMVPLLMLLIGASYMSLVVNSSIIDKIIEWSHGALRWVIQMGADLVHHLPWLSADSTTLPEWAQPAALVAATFVVLNAWRDLAVAHYHRR